MDTRLGGEPAIVYTDAKLCPTPETYMLLTNVTSIIIIIKLHC